MEDKFQVTIPKDIAEKLNLNLKQPVTATLTDDGLTIKPTSKESEPHSILLFLIPSILATILFFIRFSVVKMYHVYLTGNNSIENMMFLLGTSIPMIVFTVLFIQQKRYRKNDTVSKISWRNFPTLLIGFASMLFLINLGVFQLLGALFTGASFDLFTASILFFIFNAISNYLMITIVENITPRMIITLLISVIIGGMTLAMLSNQKLGWWHRNFSFLGTVDAKYSWVFNLTLILSGLLMIALVDYLFVAIHEAHHKNIRFDILRVLLTLTAISFCAIGFLPNNGKGTLHQLHVQSAHFLVLFIIALIISIRWLIPDIRQDFIQASYLIGTGLVASVILFQFVGYFSLTTFELLSASLSIGWLLLLLQYLIKFTIGKEVKFEISIRVEEEKRFDIKKI
ncbi:MAG: DUF998 domain-containing protein [Lactobacillales bacterium]|jgi:hypothetical membrane protein|nr:DUF998 domain-containing protein [Lactobacillales bacterium]